MMSFLDKSLLEMLSLLKNNKIDPLVLVDETINKAHKYQTVYNPFVTIIDNPLINKNAPFYGVPYVIKDNFSTKGILTTGSSRLLGDYIPVFDSTVVKKLKDLGATLIGKTVLDELAMGGNGTNGHTGIVYNPYDPTLNTLSGGSSAGSAVAVALGIVPFSIGSDTGDSVRKPAAFCGVVGFKPTYGKISRYGLFPFATSLDHVAYFTRNVKDSAFLLNHLQGKDELDSTSLDIEASDYLNNIDDNLQGKKIAIISEVIKYIEDKDVLKSLEKTIKIYENAGVIVDYVSMDEKLLHSIYSVYMILTCAEATSNTANLDGIKFGIREDGDNYLDVIKNTRTNGFSDFSKKRLILGNYVLLKENQEELFLKAQKARRLIVDATNKILSDYDAIMLPASCGPAPSFNQKKDLLSSQYLVVENHLALANFAGLPSLTLPFGFKGNLPLGVNLTSKALDEQTLFNLTSYLEDKLEYKNMIAKEEK